MKSRLVFSRGDTCTHFPIGTIKDLYMAATECKINDDKVKCCSIAMVRSKHVIYLEYELQAGQ